MALARFQAPSKRSRFTLALRVEVQQREERGRLTVRLISPFAYDVGFLGSGETIEVPVGFETDFCSVPR